MPTRRLRLSLLVCLAFGGVLGCEQEPPPPSRAASIPPIAPSVARTPPPRVTAPRWTLPDVHGTTRQLDEFRGRIVLLNFWATWCPPCRDEIPDLVQLDAAYRARGVTVIGISVDVGGARAVQPFLDHFGITYPVVLADDETAERYRVSGIPASFLLDREGRVVKRWYGPYPQEAFAQQIDALLAEEAK